MIIRERKVEHEHAYEYCVGETAIHYHNTKTLEEMGLKMPKTMKDMLDDLIIHNNNDHINLAVFGIYYAGLSTTLFAADRPSAYVTRITRLKDHYISSDVASFGSTILPMLVLTWQVKQHIIKIRGCVLSKQTQPNASNSSHWLRIYL